MWKKIAAGVVLAALAVSLVQAATAPKAVPAATATKAATPGVLTPAPTPTAPAAPVNIGEFIKEIMCMHMSGNRTSLGMWLPYEFFLAAAGAEEGMTRESAEKEVSLLKGYLVLAVQAEEEDEDGTTHYANEAEIRRRVVVRLSDGTEAAPLASVPPKVAIIAAALKAGVAQQAKDVHIVMFSNRTDDGKLIIDETKRGKLTAVLKGKGGQEDVLFTWRTPFDAATPPVPCPKCKDDVSAKWMFCPWCGQKLVR
jgi:hypothetical protein